MTGYNTECTPVAIRRSVRDEFPYGEDLANSVVFACGRIVPVRYSTRYAPAANRRPCRGCRRKTQESPPQADAPSWIFNHLGKAVSIEAGTGVISILPEEYQPDFNAEKAAERRGYGG